MPDWKLKDNTVCVSTTTFWKPIDADTPRHVKVQLLTHFGSHILGVLQPGREDDYRAWFPCLKVPEDLK